MKQQKFRIGERVHVAKDLGPTMDHFPSDKDAIVMHTYAQMFGGDDIDDYCPMLSDRNTACCWYHEDQLTSLEPTNP